MPNDSDASEVHQNPNHNPTPENDLLPLLRNPVERNLLQFNPFIGLDDILPTSPQRFRRVLSGHCSPQVPIDYRNLGSGDLSITASSYDSRDIEDPPSLSHPPYSLSIAPTSVPHSSHSPQKTFPKKSHQSPPVSSSQTSLVYSVTPTPLLAPSDQLCKPPSSQPTALNPSLPITPPSPSRRFFNALVTRKSRRTDSTSLQNPTLSSTVESKRGWNPIRYVRAMAQRDPHTSCASSNTLNSSTSSKSSPPQSAPHSPSPRVRPLRRVRSMRALATSSSPTCKASDRARPCNDTTVTKLPHDVATEGGLTPATIVADALAASGRQKWPKRRTSFRLRDPHGRGMGRFGGRRTIPISGARPATLVPFNNGTVSGESIHNLPSSLPTVHSPATTEGFDVFDQNTVEPGTTVSLHVESFMRWRAEDDLVDRTRVVDGEDEPRPKTESELSIGRTSLSSLLRSSS